MSFFIDYNNLVASSCCRFGQLCVLGLQSLSWCVVATLYKVLRQRQLQASQKMAK